MNLDDVGAAGSVAAVGSRSLDFAYVCSSTNHCWVKKDCLICTAHTATQQVAFHGGAQVSMGREERTSMNKGSEAGGCKAEGEGVQEGGQGVRKGT